MEEGLACKVHGHNYADFTRLMRNSPLTQTNP